MVSHPGHPQPVSRDAQQHSDLWGKEPGETEKRLFACLPEHERAIRRCFELHHAPPPEDETGPANRSASCRRGLRR